MNKYADLQLKTAKIRKEYIDAVVKNKQDLYKAQKAVELTYGKAFETAMDNERKKLEQLAKDKGETQVKQEIKAEDAIPMGAISDTVIKQKIANTDNRDTLFGIDIHDSIYEPFHFGFGYDLVDLGYLDEDNNDSMFIYFTPKDEHYKDLITAYSPNDGGLLKNLDISSELLDILCFNEVSDQGTNFKYLKIIKHLYDKPLKQLTLSQNEPAAKDLIKEWCQNDKFKNLIGLEYGIRTVFSKRRDETDQPIKQQPTLSTQSGQQLSPRMTDQQSSIPKSSEIPKLTISKIQPEKKEKQYKTTQKKIGRGNDEVKRAVLIKASQNAGNTSGTPELKRILKNLIKHKIMDKATANNILK